MKPLLWEERIAPLKTGLAGVWDTLCESWRVAWEVA
jgi:hypothetical protein